MINYSYIDYVNLMDLAISLCNLRSNNSQEERQKLEEHFNNSKSDLVTAINNWLLELAAKDPKNKDLVEARQHLLIEIATEQATTANQEAPKTMGKN